jgi:hypothetical protein
VGLKKFFRVVLVAFFNYELVAVYLQVYVIAVLYSHSVYPVNG